MHIYPNYILDKNTFDLAIQIFHNNFQSFIATLDTTFIVLYSGVIIIFIVVRFTTIFKLYKHFIPSLRLIDFSFLICMFCTTIATATLVYFIVEPELYYFYNSLPFDPVKDAAASNELANTETGEEGGTTSSSEEPECTCCEEDQK